VLGNGEAPPLVNISDSVAGGYFDGGSYVASFFVEAFLMQQGGGLPVAWGKVKPSALYVRL
jgi:hypothetical protein